MAITVRNKKLEERIREIGRRTGEGPTEVIARALDIREAQIQAEQEQRAGERLRRMNAALAEIPVPKEGERRATWQALDDLYGEDGLPQ